VIDYLSRPLKKGDGKWPCPRLVKLYFGRKGSGDLFGGMQAKLQALLKVRRRVHARASYQGTPSIERLRVFGPGGAVKLDDESSEEEDSE